VESRTFRAGVAGGVVITRRMVFVQAAVMARVQRRESMRGRTLVSVRSDFFVGSFF